MSTRGARFAGSVTVCAGHGLCGMMRVGLPVLFDEVAMGAIERPCQFTPFPSCHKRPTLEIHCHSGTGSKDLDILHADSTGCWMLCCVKWYCGIANGITDSLDWPLSL
jgi:hypothetical protein